MNCGQPVSTIPKSLRSEGAVLQRVTAGVGAAVAKGSVVSDHAVCHGGGSGRDRFVCRLRRWAMPSWRDAGGGVGDSDADADAAVVGEDAGREVPGCRGPRARPRPMRMALMRVTFSVVAALQLDVDSAGAPGAAPRPFSWRVASSMVVAPLVQECECRRWRSRTWRTSGITAPLEVWAIPTHARVLMGRLVHRKDDRIFDGTLRVQRASNRRVTPEPSPACSGEVAANTWQELAYQAQSSAFDLPAPWCCRSARRHRSSSRADVAGNERRGRSGARARHDRRVASFVFHLDPSRVLTARRIDVRGDHVRRELQCPRRRRRRSPSDDCRADGALRSS